MKNGLKRGSPNGVDVTPGLEPLKEADVWVSLPLLADATVVVPGPDVEVWVVILPPPVDGALDVFPTCRDAMGRRVERWLMNENSSEFKWSQMCDVPACMWHECLLMPSRRYYFAQHAFGDLVVHNLVVRCSELLLQSRPGPVRRNECLRRNVW